MNRTAAYLRRLAPYGLALILGACEQGLPTVLPDAEECCSASPDFRLTVFPLPGRTHSTISIGAVFDHSMSTLYCADNRIIAFTGETAEGPEKRKVVTFSCGDLYGFKRVGGGKFHINGNYNGGGNPEYLHYDGHPAYDFRTVDLCPATLSSPTDLCPLPGQPGRVRLRAAAVGVVACSDFDNGGGCSEGPGVVKIRHQDNYFTIYMHMESAAVETGDSIAAGEFIGVAGARGNIGPNDFSPHLHFEVRQGTVPVDPYGWEPKDQKDPYTLASSYWMWWPEDG